MSGAATARIVEDALNPQLARAHPLTQFCLEALIAGAARPRPGALAIADHLGGAKNETSFVDLYQRVGAFLARLRPLGLRPGERVMIVAAPGAQSFVALAACLVAKLDVVLAPAPLPANQHALMRGAHSEQPVALFAPASFCELDFEEPLLSIAARSPSIRCIGALNGALDGAVDFSRDMPAPPISSRPRLSEAWTEEGEQARIGALDETGCVRFLSQGALLGAALDLVRMTRAAGSAPVLTLVAPSTFGALAAGPLAALITGAPLHFLAPFEAAAFLATLDAIGPVRLVAPATIVSDLARAGVLAGGAVLSVASLSRDYAPPLALDQAPSCPIVDIQAADSGVRLRPL